MRNLQPVIWAKGTFLTPQHLQAQDRFLENLLSFRQEALSFRPYGFSNLKIDNEELAAGNFVITEASGVFPDGLPFNIPASDQPPPPKILAPYFEGDQTAVTIYLAIPSHVEGGANVSSPARNLDTRYLSEFLLVRDENTGLDERSITVARKNLRFLSDREAEARDETPVLGVARVIQTDNGLLELDPHYVPPLLEIGASDYVQSILRRLLGILVYRSTILAGMRRQKNQALADFTSSDIANFWLLYAVNSHLPLFRHLLETRGGHPEQLYSLMNSLAGALTTFSLKIQPQDLPPYAHDSLGTCLTDLDDKLRKLLDTVVPTNFISLPLKLTEPFVYATALDDDKYLANTTMFLAVKAKMSEAELISLGPKLMKVCSATHIQHLIRQALPGVEMRHDPSPPNSIPIQLGNKYFTLSQSGAAWESIYRARNFAVYAPAQFPNPELELIILLPQSA
jgi:type VI secretion system protein ImpJ